jgi:hypothetical protein
MGRTVWCTTFTVVLLGKGCRASGNGMLGSGIVGERECNHEWGWPRRSARLTRGGGDQADRTEEEKLLTEAHKGNEVFLGRGMRPHDDP